MHSTGSSARLLVRQEGKPEVTLDIGDCLRIGRSPKNDLVLDDHVASRRHAEIRHHGRGRYTLVDAGSANGTWLNGKRLTHPRELADGDTIMIGNVNLSFLASSGESDSAEPDQTETGAGTFLSLRNEVVVVLVSDIRNYTGMSEALPSREFSLLIARWFKEGTELIEEHGGTIDKFIGDAVMAYWLAGDRANPSPEVKSALATSKDLVRRAEAFDQRFSAQFPGHRFRIGVGVNLGDAVAGNVGSGQHQSFTVIGDSVNIAFRLESLTKEKGCCVVVSRKVMELVSNEFEFFDLGHAEVKGRIEPVSIWGLTV